jgi:hypothetical protein
LVKYTDGDIIAFWEDDDVYLPNHLSNIASIYDKPGIYMPEMIRSTAHQEIGNTILESADGRFHSAWAYDRKTFDELGGYPKIHRLDMDTQFLYLFGANHYYYDAMTFVYRFGNQYYHMSGYGHDGFENFWKRMGEQPAEYIGKLEPEFDEETKILLEKLCGKNV